MYIVRQNKKKRGDYLILNLWGSLASVAIIVSYIPQLKQTFTTKNVEGQNLTFWFLLSFSVAFFLVNAIATKAGLVNVVAQSFNFLGAFSMLVMVKLYAKRND